MIERNFHSEYNFLLNFYTPEDIDMVANDLIMYSNNYHFLFILDTYDVVENYLPYTDMELFSTRDLNFQAQKYICYDYFFGGFNKTEAILLNEYKIELLAAKNKLNKHLREAKGVLKNLEKLKKETNSFINDPEKTEGFFRNNFEIILLLLILNDKTNSILGEFFDFIKTRLQVSEVKGAIESDSEMLTSIFDKCTFSKFSVDVFAKYIEENKIKLLSVDNTEERHVFLENTFRDIKVIERIMHINAELSKNNLKYHAIYLSSANKTGDIMSIVNTMTSDSVQFTEDQSKKFHRNIYQYFLFDRIKNEYRNDIESALKILNSLKILLDKMSNKSFSIQYFNNKDEYNDVLKIVKGLFDEKSGFIDNHFYLNVYDKYKGTFNEMLHSKTSAPLNSSELIKIIIEVDKNKVKYKDKIFDLEFTLSQLNQTYDIVDSFQGIDEYEPDYRYGNDIIRNPYQHLPILLLIDQKFDSQLKENLYKFLNTNIELKEKDKPLLKYQLKNIVDELYKMESRNLSTKMLKSMVITYLNLIAQAKQKEFKPTQIKNEASLENSIIIDFEKQYEIVKLQSERIDHGFSLKSNKIKYLVEHNGIVIEIAYVLIWLYRRNDREDEGIKKGKEILSMQSADPRIDQGIALCYISKVYKLIKNQTALVQVGIYVDAALSYLRFAKDKYQQLINKNSEFVSDILLLKNYIAILNSLSDMYIRKHEINLGKFDSTLIENARYCLDEIKTLFDSIKLIYDDHPTYSATEFEIEYYEALHFYQSKEMSKAHQKILNAMSRIKMLKETPNSNTYVDELFLQKESNLNELAMAIFKHYS